MFLQDVGWPSDPYTLFECFWHDLPYIFVRKKVNLSLLKSEPHPWLRLAGCMSDLGECLARCNSLQVIGDWVRARSESESEFETTLHFVLACKVPEENHY